MKLALCIILLVIPIGSFGSPISSLCSPSGPDDFQGCPCGWVHREGNCYKLFTELQTFDEAEAICKTQNSHLASVTSKPEHEFLLSYILREVVETDLKYVWVGGRRKRTRYIWTDLQPFEFADWHPAHAGYSDLAQHPTFDCVQFVTTAGHYTGDTNFGTIVNHPCIGKDNFICKRSAVSSKDPKPKESKFEGRIVASY